VHATQNKSIMGLFYKFFVYFVHTAKRSEGTMLKRYVLPFCILLLLTGCSMESTMSAIINFSTARFINYVLLFCGFLLIIVVMDHAKDNFGVTLIGLALLFAMLATSVFYWRMWHLLPDLPEKEIFATSFDIGLAHGIVSISILFFLGNGLYMAVWIIGRILGSLIGVSYTMFDRIFKTDSTRGVNFASGCLGNVLTAILLGGIPFGYYILLIGTIDLQLFLFGNYDPSLSWNYPTTFTFISLMQQLQVQWEAIKNDPVLGLFIIPLGIFVAVVMKIGDFIGAILKPLEFIQKIRSFFDKNTTERLV